MRRIARSKTVVLSALAIAVAAALGPVASAEVSKTLSFGQLSFDPFTMSQRASGRYRTSSTGEGLRFVQFETQVRSEYLQQLRSAGAVPLQYYPNDTYLVWSSDASLRAVESASHVRWTGSFEPAWKIDRSLDKRGDVIRNVAVHFYNDGNVPALLAALHAAGATVLTHGPAQSDQKLFDAWIEVPAAALSNIAELPHVVWLEFASPVPMLDDEMSSQILARNYNASNVPQTGYLSWLGTVGLNGNGVIWTVIDSGVDLTHPDLSSRIAGGFTYPGCPAGTGPGDDNAQGGHGTHVAGIIAGTAAAATTDAGGFFYGQGMAPAARIYAQNPICVSGTPWPPAGGWQVLSKNAVAAGAVGGNGSWTSGEGTNAGYTTGARAWDQIVRDGNFDSVSNEAFVMVFSAGNSGPNANTLTAPKEAKNPIITASSRNYRVGQNIDAISSFSSRGPTVDGRFGITIATPGEQIASARRVAGASQCGTAIAGSDNNYAFCSGTSMAAPHASGVAVLLTEWWRNNNAQASPSPAMIKALMINGARDTTTAPTIPNTTEGWGLVDVPGSLGRDFNNSEYIDQTQILDSVGETWTATYGVTEPGRPVRISLAWTDAAAALSANPTLVNNLDLEVVSGGQTYLGNVFTSGASSTGGTADSRNNVENVFIANPGGDVVVRVVARNLPGDGIPNQGAVTDQDFALVCRNCAEEPGYSLTPSPDSRTVCAPAVATYPITVGSILGFTETVSLSAAGQPAGSTAAFAPNPSTVPGASALTIGNTAGAAPGTYAITINGQSTPSNFARSAGVALTIANASPTAPVPTAPVNGANNQAAAPVLSWTVTAQAASYRVVVATEPTFAAPVFDRTLGGTSTTVAPALNSSALYHWRVTATNACGTSTNSQIFTFRTAPAPGDCAAGSTANSAYSEDFTSGLGAYTTTGSTGASTWSVSTAQPGSPSGGNKMQAQDIATLSDQRLISPSIALPANQLPLTLQFWNDQSLESRSAGGCFDAGLLEVSTNGGANWTQIGNAALLTQPYTGAISGGPANGLQGWCGDPVTWRRSIVDLAQYAGQTVQFRWRLSTDGSVGRATGWHLDDIKVQSCAISDPAVIFGNSFE